MLNENEDIHVQEKVQRGSKKRGRDDDILNAQGKALVYLKSFKKSLVNVALATIESKDPLKKVGGCDLGYEYWEVAINVALVHNEPLPRPYAQFKTIGDAIGATIAWPFTLCMFRTTASWMNFSTARRAPHLCTRSWRYLRGLPLPFFFLDWDGDLLDPTPESKLDLIFTKEFGGVSRDLLERKGNGAAGPQWSSDGTGGGGRPPELRVPATGLGCRGTKCPRSPRMAMSVVRRKHSLIRMKRKARIAAREKKSDGDHRQ
ncbi:hypothetical protein Taro_007427 [Colocasia esculenta]|uniref:Transposase Tnp1/En/Spm-like domain-containing protein n=1 Tax=Colocasia esculenta TaxID=4460 RepID=A0A843TUZ6_COLES|nr:hypothetical protein [Colocasia esculenta]